VNYGPIKIFYSEKVNIMPNLPTGYQKTLIDSIFFDQDQQLLQDFRKRMEKIDRRDQLIQVSGIHDEAVLDRLIELDINPETLAAMSVVPLVSVAWADGEIQTKEREVIISAAKDAGIEPKDGRYPVLEHWLKKHPGPEMVEAWKHYIQGLCKKLSPKEIEELKHDLLDLARNVAQAAGGFLGLGNKISAAEQNVLDDLTQAFS
jgi:tellurite resistance protein